MGGFYLVFILGICLLYDVYKNGYIKTDLDSLGVFLMCIGVYVAGNGVNKAISERRKGNLNENSRNSNSEGKKEN